MLAALVNAFNTLPWSRIRKVVHRRIPLQLREIIGSYLSCGEVSETKLAFTGK